METKKSKVVSTTLKKEGTGTYGKYFIHVVSFENGDSGDYMAKSNPQNYFKVGVDADYTKEEVKNGDYLNIKIKPIQAPQGGKFFGGSPTAQNKRTALECAVSLCVAGKITFESIGAQSVKFAAWLNDEPKKPEPPKQQAPPPAQEPDYSMNMTGSTDDLPF